MHLCSHITEIEIAHCLESIGNDKVPGINGYNVVFFKKPWQIIKHEVVEVVGEFFNAGILYKPIKCTTVTLVPKNYSLLISRISTFSLLLSPLQNNFKDLSYKATEGNDHCD